MALKVSELNQILDGRKFGCFVETGTFKGVTTMVMSKNFKTVHTFELDKQLFVAARNKARSMGLNNITFHHGDTEKIFPGVVKDIKEDVVFYLDAHKTWGGGRTLGAVGQNDVPLMTEVRAINDRNYNDVIIIDDYRLFDNRWFKEKGKPVKANWKGIHEEAILAILEPKSVVSTYVYNDRFIINLQESKK